MTRFEVERREAAGKDEAEVDVKGAWRVQIVQGRTLRREDDGAAAAAGAPEGGRETIVGEEVLLRGGATEGLLCATGGVPLGGPNNTGGGLLG